MGKRRGHGEGSVFWDERRGRWVALLDLGQDGAGKRRRVWRSAKDKGDALAILRNLQGTVDRGDDPRGARRTFRTALDDFKVNGVDKRRAASTIYKTTLYASSFADAIGTRPLREVSVRHVEQWLGKLAKAGKSRSTLIEARAATVQVFAHAIRIGWLPPERNPARLARIPEAPGPKARPVLDDEAVGKLLKAADDEPWAPLLTFIAVTGARIGEALALAYSDVDSEACTVTIRRAVRVEPDGSLSFTTPKSNSGRVIGIPPGMVDIIKAHRVATAEKCLALGRSTPDLAFPTTVGTVGDPNDLRRWLRTTAAKAKVTCKGFHDLRHAVASSLADTGSLPIHVAALLGHAKATTTLGVYTHSVRPTADAGLDRAARLLEK